MGVEQTTYLMPDLESFTWYSCARQPIYCCLARSFRMMASFYAGFFYLAFNGAVWNVQINTNQQLVQS
jgi:hypothetical protein